jgi:hypothetical protein
MTAGWSRTAEMWRRWRRRHSRRGWRRRHPWSRWGCVGARRRHSDAWSRHHRVHSLYWWCWPEDRSRRRNDRRSPNRSSTSRRSLNRRQHVRAATGPGKTKAATNRHRVRVGCPIARPTLRRILQHRQWIDALALNPHWVRMVVDDATARQRRPAVHRNDSVPCARRTDVSPRDRTRRRTIAARCIPNCHDGLPAESALSRHPPPAEAVPVIPRAAVIWQPTPRIR